MRYLDLLLDDGLDVPLGDALDARVELQVLAAGQQVEERVELGAVPHQPSDHFRVAQQVVSAQPGLAVARRELAWTSKRGGMRVRECLMCVLSMLWVEDNGL